MKEADDWDHGLAELATPAPLLQSWAWGDVQARAGWNVERLSVSSHGPMASVLTRTVGGRGKAGNMNYALARTDGDFVAVIDADHVARTELGRETLGYFGEMCVGVAMPAARFFGYSGGDLFFVSSDYGTAFLVAAGMLNMLCLLDAYDIAMGRKP